MKDIVLDTCFAEITKKPVLVGLSGGRDSVALLNLLIKNKVDIYACHVHHGIRSEEADRDAKFCEDLCSKLHIELTVVKEDIPSIAKERKESIETAARNIRREVLIDVARSYNIETIALAHHADDQAETALFRLSRGSAGCRAMLPISDYSGLTLIRPLLYYRRADITEWLKNNEVPWVDDSTNSELDTTRNQIRHIVIPALNLALNRDVVPLIGRSARLHTEMAEALAELLESQGYKDPQGRFYIPYMEGKSNSLKKIVIKKYLQENGIRNISEYMVNEVLSITNPESSRYCLTLPGGMSVYRKNKRLIISKNL